MRHVDAEPVAPAVEPEPQGLLELGVDVGVRPVDVGLLRGEQAQVPLLTATVGVRQARPGGAAEHAHPVVRRFGAVLAAAVPDNEPLALR